MYDVVMPDVKYAGGLAEMLRIAEVAANHDVLCSPHNPTSPIAHLHGVSPGLGIGIDMAKLQSILETGYGIKGDIVKRAGVKAQ